MSKIFFIILIFVSRFIFAQSAEVLEMNQRVLAESRGTCSILENPHSYACNDWTFNGNSIFPLFPMDWMGRLQGNWSMVTYADREGNENAGPEFSMLLTKGRHTKPAGVFDFKSNRVVGNMRIVGPIMNYENWKGRPLSTTPSSFNVIDNMTVQMQAVEGQKIHIFLCRDFDRIKTHHLLCRWDESNGRTAVHKGYLGFLRTVN